MFKITSAARFELTYITFQCKTVILTKHVSKVNFPLFEAKKPAWKRKLAWYFSIKKAMQEKNWKKWLNWPDIWNF